jgi:hypothetical protein
MTQARLADGTILEFPDGTDPAVMEKAVKSYISGQGAPAPVPVPVPVPEWADVPGQTVSNIGPSAARFAGDIKHMVTSPVETGESLWNLAAGAAQKLIPDSWTDGPMGKEKYADAMGQFFAERYGGEDEIKTTLATDPVGVLADFSAFLTGGAMAAAKVPMIAAKTAKVAGKVPALSTGARAAESAVRSVEPTIRNIAGTVGDVGKWADPLYTTARGAGKAISIPEALLGTYSGVGSSPIREAAVSGFKGGESGKAFRENMRGVVDYEKIVTDARGGLQQLKNERNSHYKSGMIDISKDKTVLDFGEIDRALGKAFDDNTFKGVPKSKPTQKALKDIDELITEWRSYDPAEFHTPEGMDALKQNIGSLIDWKSNTKAQNLAAQAMYDNVGALIRKQAPIYDEIMKDYSKASTLIKEIEKSFSLGKNATADTALRKLTSVMRNNVNTNYGARAASAEVLQTASGKPLMSSLAGQSMSSMNPRGLAGTGLQTSAPILASIISGNPLPLAALPLQMPRLVGEAVHAGGRGSGAGSKVAGMIEALLDKGGMSSRGLASTGYQLQRPDSEERRLEEEKRRRLQSFQGN